MSEQEKEIVQEYCERLDKRYARLLHVIYGLIVCIIGAVGTLSLDSFHKIQLKETPKSSASWRN